MLLENAKIQAAQAAVLFSSFRRSPAYLAWYVATRAAVAATVAYIISSQTALAGKYMCLEVETSAFRQDHTREQRDMMAFSFQSYSNITGKVSENERLLEELQLAIAACEASVNQMREEVEVLKKRRAL